MPTKSSLPEHPSPCITCECGAEILLDGLHAGMRLKCRTCRRSVKVPQSPSGEVPVLLARKGNRWVTGTLAGVLLALIAGVATFFYFDAQSQQAQVQSAQTELGVAIRGALAWLKQGEANEGDLIEQRLVRALADPILSDTADAPALLSRVRTRRAQLAAASSHDAVSLHADMKAKGKAVAPSKPDGTDPQPMKTVEHEKPPAEMKTKAKQSTVAAALIPPVEHPDLPTRETGSASQVNSIAPVPPPNDVKSPAADGWVPLFNGQDLKGWKTHPVQPGRWRVENGILIGSDPDWTGRPRVTPEYEHIPRGTHLYTERDDFANFHLRVEAQVNDRGDSGVYFRCQFGPGGDRYPTFPIGYEADIHRAEAGTLVTLNDGVLRRTNIHKPLGEWILLEVIGRKSQVTIKVNGEVAVDFLDPDRRYTKGHIALQCWEKQTEVRFRKIEIKELVVPVDPLDVEANRPRRPEEQERFIKQQIQELELNRVVDKVSDQETKRRERAIENLKKLGPAASPALPALAWATLAVHEEGIRRKASDLVGEIGGVQGYHALYDAIREFYYLKFDYKTRNEAEDALLKLLPLLGKHMTLEDAVDLWELHQIYPQRRQLVLPAFERAWIASGISPAAVANELLRRQRAKSKPSPGSDRLKRPIPSPLTWTKLVDSDFVVLPEGVVNMQPKTPWALWREQNPELASIEMQKAAAQMIENEKRLGRIQLKDPDEIWYDEKGIPHVRRRLPGN